MTDAMRKLVSRADEWLNTHREEIILELQTLARIPSVSRADPGQEDAPFGPECRRVLDTAAQMGRELGFETRVEKGCVGIISMGPRDRRIGIMAHLDVVPAGDGWVYPPFDAVYLPEHDALVGRGVNDNKAAAIMGLSVMRMLRDFQIPLHCGVDLYCGSSEETGMQDMRILRKAGHVFPDLSLVPDAAFPVNYAQKGGITGYIRAEARGNLLSMDCGNGAFNVIPDRARCTLQVSMPHALEALGRLDTSLQARLGIVQVPEGVEITASGVSGHAAHPERSLNALHVLSRGLTEMEILEGSCRQAVAGLCTLTSDTCGKSEGVAFEDEISGVLTLVYTLCRLKDGFLEIGLDSRVPVTCPMNSLVQSLTSAWASLGYSVITLETADAFHISRDSRFVQALQEIYENLTGRKDPCYSMGGGTYSRVIPDAISFGMGMPGASEDLSFLPEGHGGVHGRDEVLFVQDLLNCARIYLPAIVQLDGLLQNTEQ